MKYVRLHTINILMHNNDVLTRIFSINAYNIQLWDAMLTIAQTESVTGTEVFKAPQCPAGTAAQSGASKGVIVCNSHGERYGGSVQVG